MDRLTASAVEGILDEYESFNHADGVCCCGDYMDNHSDPMFCGHSPVDSGEYHASLMLKAAREELQQLRELLRQAGNALEIQGNQKARALRFQILNFLKGGVHEA